VAEDQGWIDIVPNIDGYEKVRTPALRRMAAGGDEGAMFELERRKPAPTGGAAPRTGWDAVVNDEPYHAMPLQLLRSLVADGDQGAVEELERRGMPLE